MALEVGDVAPPFVLPDQDGVDRSLTALNDRPLLIVFYPADGTPGCTTQACDIRDRWSEFEALGVRVVGVSPDDVPTHAGFAAEYGLPQLLLADPDHHMIEAYGAWGERMRNGQPTIGVLRSSVLIDLNGRIVKAWRQAQAADHAEVALAVCRELLG